MLFYTAMGEGIESCFKTVQEMEGEERPHCTCYATKVFQWWNFLNIVILTVIFYFVDIGIQQPTLFSTIMYERYIDNAYKF
jgi:hypothetical protein